ncbi:MAG: O-unit flippase-like protein [Paludibacteraceae bacterium]
MEINRIDILWNYAATFLKIAASALLLPFILKMLSPETIGIWTIFMTVTSFSGLLDFGFSPSFTRNITYIFSGIKKLEVNGYTPIDSTRAEIDFGLLKGTISAMRWFYFRIALILFILLVTAGTYYISYLLKSYSGNKSEIYISWFILIIINTYNLFTLYYEALLQGKGLVKRQKQIIILGQSVYLIISILLVLLGSGLIAIVSAQAISVIIVRWLSYKSFFTTEIKDKVNSVVAYSKDSILKIIYPNVLKIGLTSFGGFLVQKSALIIGSFYLTLTDLASYGITIQLLSVLASLSGIYTATYMPKIVQYRVRNDIKSIQYLYRKGQFILIATFLVGGGFLVLFGQYFLKLIGSQTPLLPPLVMSLCLLIVFLENNHAIAGNIILSKNEVPFFKASLLSGAATILLLFLSFKFTNLGILSMIIAPGIAQVAYQNWKWPFVVMKDLKMLPLK